MTKILTTCRDLLACAVCAAALLGALIWMPVHRHAPVQSALSQTWSIGSAKPEIELTDEPRFRLPRRWLQRIEAHLRAGGSVEFYPNKNDLTIHLSHQGSI